jgi:hypothetical protein
VDEMMNGVIDRADSALEWTDGNVSPDGTSIPGSGCASLIRLWSVSRASRDTQELACVLDPSGIGHQVVQKFYFHLSSKVCGICVTVSQLDGSCCPSHTYMPRSRRALPDRASMRLSLTPMKP